MRLVILHYHLFKNAGTSLDHILQNQFPGRWATREFPMAAPNTAAVCDWITSQPDTIAFSSHTMTGPLPRVEGLRIIPVVLLRDPIARIISAYHFERRQQAQTFGAQLAKQQDLPGYVETRLMRAGDRQCRNFQTHRLAPLVPGTTSEPDRAAQALTLVANHGVLGLVAEFETALERLRQRVVPTYPAFSPLPTRQNTGPAKTIDSLPLPLRSLLERANADDIALLSRARQVLNQPAAPHLTAPDQTSSLAAQVPLGEPHQ